MLCYAMLRSYAVKPQGRWELEGAPAGFTENSCMKQQIEKTNAHNRTSVWELVGAPAGFTVNSRMKQQVEKQTHAAELR